MKSNDSSKIDDFSVILWINEFFFAPLLHSEETRGEYTEEHLEARRKDVDAALHEKWPAAREAR